MVSEAALRSTATPAKIAANACVAEVTDMSDNISDVLIVLIIKLGQEQHSDDTDRG